MSMPTIGSTEARTLTRLQERVLHAVDDNFVQTMGATATAQYIEVVEGLFVPNRRRGTYVLSATDLASERVPVLLRSKSRIAGCSAGQTPLQRERTMQFIDSEACSDLSRAQLAELRESNRANEHKKRIMRVSKHAVGICDSAESRINLGSGKGIVDVRGRPLIAMRTDDTPILTLAHETCHAAEWLNDPVARFNPEQVAGIELDSELKAYTVQALVEDALACSPSEPTEFVMRARLEFEDPLQPFISNNRMREYFANHGRTGLYTP